MTFRLSLSDEQKKMKAKLVQKLLQDEIVVKWLKENHDDVSIVEEHSGRFDDWLVRKQKCLHCKGLMTCTQEKQGYLLDLTYDGFLNNELKSCHYLNESKKALAHVDNYLIHHCSNELLQVNFAGLDMAKETIEYRQLCEEIIHSLSEVKGLYLHGKPGVGKTYLGACITNFYAKKQKKCAFVNVPTLINELKLSMRDDNGMEQILNALKRADVLLLDDIGGESVSSWSRDEILMPLLNERMEKKKKTYFTSNYTMLELENHFAYDSRGNCDLIKANRLIERIKALSFEKNVKGCNRRV